MKKFRFGFLRRVATALGLIFTGLTPGVATEITIGFDSPTGGPIPLRLNQASNGWTQPVWSDYYDDIGVEYRRMDHWNDCYNVVRRRPDGGLSFDSAQLDQTIYQSTGGFAFKAYPTVDLCPPCLDTDLWVCPLQLNRGSLTGYATPAGTLIFSGQARPPGWGTSTPSGLYEINRKGVIIHQWPFQKVQLVSNLNHIAIPTAQGWSLLGPDRKEIAHGAGTAVQEMGDNQLLTLQGGKLLLVDYQGKVLHDWGAPPSQHILLTSSGLVSYSHNELTLTDTTGKVKSMAKLDPKFFPSDDSYLAWNPNDSQNRIYLGMGTHAQGSGGNYLGQVFAFSSTGDPIWKSDQVPSDSVRGIVATHDGMAVLGTAGTVYGITQSGVVWKTGVRGALDMQLVISPGLETVVMRTYEDEVDEYDVRTGDALLRYGENSDQSPWACVPPTDLNGWQETMAYYLKHYMVDMGLNWNRWELWNEPTDHGFFWAGTWLDYAKTLDVTMKAMEQVAPSITMDAYDGSGWYPQLLKYCSDNKIRIDGLTWHGYLSGDEDYEQDELQALGQRNGELSKYPASKTQLGNSEWNVHPGQGEDLSQKYTTGYFRAPFQSEMVYLMGNAGAKFTSEFSMHSDMMWPAGWVYTYTKPVGGMSPPAGGTLEFITPAYNAARLWAMLPAQQAPVKNNFAVHGTWSNHVNAVASCDPTKGEYGVLVWNTSNNAKAAGDETVTLKMNFKGESSLHMRHFVIDQDHSFYGKAYGLQYLQAVESGSKSASDLANVTVVLKKDSLHAFFFTRDPLKADAGKSITVEAHHRVVFDASGSTGLPAFYRWDTDSAKGATFPEPNSEGPGGSHLFGMKPVLAYGYAKPGTYTVTLRVSGDGYHKETDTATTTVTVLPETTGPEAPEGLETNCGKTDHEVYLQWDALNFAKNSDVVGFNIYRKESGGDWKKLAKGSTATSYLDTGVTEGTPYTYRVAAFDSSGNESGPSNEATATFKLNTKAPKMPVNLKGVILSGTDIVKLDWDNDNLADGACVTGYNIYRRNAGSGDWQKLTDTQVVYKRYYDEVTNVGMASHYQYCVTALDFSKNESLQTDAITPAAK